MKSNITMKDIAERLNISTVTVSKALGNKEGVSQELKEKIIKLADEMGYKYNVIAKAMKDGCTYNISVIVAERFVEDKSFFYLEFSKVISKELQNMGYYPIVEFISDEDEKNLKLPRTYYESRCDAFIVLGQISKDYIKNLKNINVPIVFLDFYDEHEEFDAVVMDNFFSAYEVTNYLYNNGHDKIGFVGDIYATSSIQDRYLGYYKSLLEHNMKLNENYIINDRDDKGEFIQLKLPSEMPSAFLCNNDVIAFRLINDLVEMGYDVPKDISVVAFDNTLYSTISKPQITSVKVNIVAMTRKAVEIIVNKIKNPSSNHGKIFIKGEIIYRDSVSNKKCTTNIDL